MLANVDYCCTAAAAAAAAAADAAAAAAATAAVARGWVALVADSNEECVQQDNSSSTGTRTCNTRAIFA